MVDHIRYYQDPELFDRGYYGCYLDLDVIAGKDFHHTDYLVLVLEVLNQQDVSPQDRSDPKRRRLRWCHC